MPRNEAVRSVKVGIPYELHRKLEEAEAVLRGIPKGSRRTHMIANGTDLLHHWAMFHQAGYTFVADVSQKLEFYNINDFISAAKVPDDWWRREFGASPGTFWLLEKIRKLVKLEDDEQVLRMGLLVVCEHAHQLMNGARLYVTLPNFTYAPENIYLPEFLRPFGWKTFQ